MPQGIVPEKDDWRKIQARGRRAEGPEKLSPLEITTLGKIIDAQDSGNLLAEPESASDPLYKNLFRMDLIGTKPGKKGIGPIKWGNDYLVPTDKGKELYKLYEPKKDAQ